MKLICPVPCKAVLHETAVSMDDRLEVTGGKHDSGVSSSNSMALGNVSKNPSCEFHYVPILETLKTYLQQGDVWASCQQKRDSGGMLHDFTDGRMWQNAAVGYIWTVTCMSEYICTVMNLSCVIH